jgi:hypothetical protein
VLVCTGLDIPDRDLVVGHIKKFLAMCGYANPSVEVLLQNQLRGFLAKFPSVALKVNEREIGALRSHKSWSSDAEMEKPFKPGDKQRELILDLQRALVALALYRKGFP